MPASLFATGISPNCWLNLRKLSKREWRKPLNGLLRPQKKEGSRPSFAFTCDRPIVNIPREAVRRRRSERKLGDIRRRREAGLPESLRRIVSHIASLLPTPNVEVAQAIFATLVGTLQLARAVSDPVLSDQLLKAGQDSALLLAKYKS